MGYRCPGRECTRGCKGREVGRLDLSIQKRCDRCRTFNRQAYGVQHFMDRRQCAFHCRMRVTAKTWSNNRERRSPETIRTARREMQIPPSKPFQPRMVHCPAARQLPDGKGQEIAGPDPPRRGHVQSPQCGQTVAPLSREPASQAGSTTLRQRTVGAAEHRAQQDGRRNGCGVLESECSEHGNIAAFGLDYRPCFSVHSPGSNV